MPRRLSLAVISVFLGIHLVYAQVTTGTISGVVQDASGGAIAETAVTVRNLDTGTARTVSTDAGGRYTIPDLPVGNYEIQAQHPGFQTEVRSGVNLTVGARLWSTLLSRWDRCPRRFWSPEKRRS